MSAPFSKEEQRRIRAGLAAAALRHAQAEGMKHTTVERLAREAGISKGAFYRFYDSKELLFLDMLEQWYQGVEEVARAAYGQNIGLPVSRRSALMLRDVVQWMTASPLSRFMRDDVPLLLRRLPQKTLEQHYTGEDEFILRLLRWAQIPLRVSEGVAVAIIRMLVMSIIYSDDIGPQYRAALSALIDSACSQLIAVE